MGQNHVGKIVFTSTTQGDQVLNSNIVPHLVSTIEATGTIAFNQPCFLFLIARVPTCFYWRSIPLSTCPECPNRFICEPAICSSSVIQHPCFLAFKPENFILVCRRQYFASPLSQPDFELFNVHIDLLLLRTGQDSNLRLAFPVLRSTPHVLIFLIHHLSSCPSFRAVLIQNPLSISGSAHPNKLL